MAEYKGENEFEGLEDDNLDDGEKYPDIKYEDILIDEPPRKDNSSNYDPAASMSSAIDNMQHKSELQTIMDSLTPIFKYKRLNEILQPAMVSRMQPDNIIDADKLVFASMLESYDEDESYKFDPIYTIMSAHNAHMIAYKGMGIGDRLEAAGAVREAEIKKLAEGLNL